jgi:hypothetical protein
MYPDALPLRMLRLFLVVACASALAYGFLTDLVR